MTGLSTPATAALDRTATGSGALGPGRTLAPVAGALVGIAGYLLLAGGALPAVAGPAWLLVMLVALPSSARLSRRLALNGAMFMGWTPTLWMLPLPVGLHRGALVCAGGTAVLVCWVAVSGTPGERLRTLVPSFHVTDACLPLVALAALVTFRLWISASTPQQALKLLLVGYDNVAHFDIFRMLRLNGMTVHRMGISPDGTGWSYGEYPHASHALLATYADLVQPTPGSGSQDLLLYMHVSALAMTVALLVLVGALCSIPRLTDRPLVMLPSVALTVAAFLWTPGASAIADGFANFWIAAVLASTTILLAMSVVGGDPQLRVIAAASGALSAAALTWVPLALLASPALLLLCPSGRARNGTRSPTTAWVGRLFLLAAVLAVVKAASMIVGHVAVSTLVGAEGQVTGTSIGPLLIIAIVAIGGLTRYPRMVVRASPEADDPPDSSRLRALSLTPIGGMVVLAILLLMQLRTLGTTSYFFLKLLVGYELVIVPMTAALVALYVVALVPRRVARPRALLLAVGSAVVAAQFLGQVAPGSAPMLVERTYGTDADGEPLSLAAMSSGIIASVGQTDVGFDREYVALGVAHGYTALLPAVWHHSLTSTLTVRSQERMSSFNGRIADPDEAVAPLRRMMLGHPTCTVIVDPHYVARLQARLGSDLAGRVVGWR